MIHMLSAFFLYHIKLRVTLLSRISRYETRQYASSVFVATNTILLVGAYPKPCLQHGWCSCSVSAEWDQHRAKLGLLTKAVYIE